MDATLNPEGNYGLGGMEMLDYEKTGQLIQQRRRELNITQKELAERLGVTDRAVSKWETGVSQS